MQPKIITCIRIGIRSYCDYHHDIKNVILAQVEAILIPHFRDVKPS